MIDRIIKFAWLILAAGMLFTFWLYSQNNRYEFKQMGEHQMMLDTRTGTAYALTASGWHTFPPPK